MELYILRNNFFFLNDWQKNRMDNRVKTREIV